VARRKQRELWTGPPRGHFTTNIFSFCRTHFMPPAPPRGPAIDVSNSDGDRCRTYRQHPLGGPPSTSLTPMVAAAEPAASTPQGACHRRLKFRWWPLPDLPPAPRKGPTINVSNSDDGRCRTCCQNPPGGPPSMSPTSVVAVVGPAASTPQGARHRRLQFRWWPLSDLPPAPPPPKGPRN
jgi:hypothetical protein